MRALFLLVTTLFVCCANAGGTSTVDTEKYLFSLSEEIHQKEDRMGFLGLSRTEQTFLLVLDLEAEVNNGGFDQFYLNSAGDRAVLTVNALRVIGAYKTAGIVERANNLFGPGGPSKSRTVRHEQLLSFPEAAQNTFEELDAGFYEYPDNLTELLAAYIRRNK